VLKGRLRFLPGYLPEALAMCRRLKAEGTAEGLFLQHQQFFKKNWLTNPVQGIKIVINYSLSWRLI